MATQTQHCTTFDLGGVCTVDITYDDVTDVASSLVVTNNSTVQATATVSKGDGTNPIARTLAPGASTTVALPTSGVNKITLTRIGTTSRWAGYRLTALCPG